MTVKLPIAFPTVIGANATDMLMDFCGAKVTGKVGPARLKPVPETDAFDTVRLNLVAFVMATDSISTLLTCTLPKLMLAEDAVCPIAFELKKIKARTSGPEARLERELGQVVIICSLQRAPRARRGIFSCRPGAPTRTIGATR